jgi:hypothetical protein
MIAGDNPVALYEGVPLQPEVVNKFGFGSKRAAIAAIRERWA